MTLVSLVAIPSMAGIAVVATVPAALGGGMAALFILGLIDGPRGGRLTGEEPEAEAKADEKAA